MRRSANEMSVCQTGRGQGQWEEWGGVRSAGRRDERRLQASGQGGRQRQFKKASSVVNSQGGA